MGRVNQQYIHMNYIPSRIFLGSCVLLSWSNGWFLQNSSGTALGKTYDWPGASKASLNIMGYLSTGLTCGLRYDGTKHSKTHLFVYSMRYVIYMYVCKCRAYLKPVHILLFFVMHNVTLMFSGVPATHAIQKCCNIGSISSNPAQFCGSKTSISVVKSLGILRSTRRYHFRAFYTISKWFDKCERSYRQTIFCDIWV